MISTFADSSGFVKTKERTLVLTGTRPGTDGVGAVLLQQVLEHLPREDCRLVSFVRDVSDVPEPLEILLKRRYEHFYRPIAGAFGDTIGLGAFNFFTRRYAKALADDCCAYGRAERVSRVLAVLDCPTTMLVAREVACKLRVPLSAFVMDTPRVVLGSFGYSEAVIRSCLRVFDRLIDACDVLAVAGEAMQSLYEARYGKRCFIFRQGINGLPPFDAGSPIPIGGVIRIGFAGSFTANDSFNSLLDELAVRNWKVSGRDIVFRVVGSDLRIGRREPVRIEYCGWHTGQSLLSLLKECDYLYLPQPFDPSRSELAMFSFPNKVCTYVAAGRPILLHAPRHGSLNDFFKAFPCGPVCNELNPGSLLDAMDTSIADAESYNRYRDACRLAVSDALGTAQFARQVSEFMRHWQNGRNV